MKIYHGTTRNCIAKIMSQGLKPKAGKSSEYLFMGKRIKAVGLTKQYIDAWAYASRKALMCKDIPIVLILEYPENKLYASYETKCEETEMYISMEKIPAKYIIGFKTVKILNEDKTQRILGLMD